MSNLAMCHHTIGSRLRQFPGVRLTHIALMRSI